MLYKLLKKWVIAVYSTAVRLPVTAISDIACSFERWPQMAVKIKFIRLATDGSNRKSEFIKDHVFTFCLRLSVTKLAGLCCVFERVDRKVQKISILFDKRDERDFGLGDTTMINLIVE